MSVVITNVSFEDREPSVEKGPSEKIIPGEKVSSLAEGRLVISPEKFNYCCVIFMNKDPKEASIVDNTFVMFGPSKDIKLRLNNFHHEVENFRQQNVISNLKEEGELLTNIVFVSQFNSQDYEVPLPASNILNKKSRMKAMVRRRDKVELGLLFADVDEREKKHVEDRLKEQNQSALQKIEQDRKNGVRGPEGFEDSKKEFENKVKSTYRSYFGRVRREKRTREEEAKKNPVMVLSETDFDEE